MTYNFCRSFPARKVAGFGGVDSKLIFAVRAYSVEAREDEVPSLHGGFS